MEKKKNDLKLNLIILGVAALMVLSCVAGFQLGRRKDTAPVLSTESTAPTDGQELSGQRLVLAVAVDYDAGSVDLAVAGREDTVQLRNLAAVDIDLPQGTMALSAALAGGHVTPEELIAWAKLDAAAGFCKETSFSENGFAHFVYRYANVELSVYDDVFEAPNGEHYHIRDLTVRDPGSQGSGVNLYIEGEDGLLYDLTKEDWGLSFELTEADANGLTLTCTQSGGQQIGQLAVHSYMVSKLHYEGADKLPVKWDAEDSSQWLMIQNDGTTVFRLVWENALPSGEYGLHLFVRDVYDPEDIHPLIRNFEDGQTFSVTFTVEPPRETD